LLQKKYQRKYFHTREKKKKNREKKNLEKNKTFLHRKKILPAKYTKSSLRVGFKPVETQAGGGKLKYRQLHQLLILNRLMQIA